MTFKDHFSRRAAQYAAYRPEYPRELFAHLAGVAPARTAAWDCATGNGQAALGLAEHFARVVATDASADQIAHAREHPRVEYRVAPAERCGLADASVALVTVAQALHWLDAPAFYAEAERVLVRGGVVAVWTYGGLAFDDAALDALVRRFAHEVVGPYWPPERRIVDEGYRTIAFPFAELQPPAFTLERRWTLAELAGYLRTWSATARYVEARAHDPVEALEAELGAAWGDARGTHVVRWPLAMRLGTTGR